ncbi:hypothetical protein INT48_005822 [Thamnidium elegans]|uniref:Uncharacterized protein n=1 Tax=Thamnidium elegans TaxID=101142 RepID=A0A8H7SR21_9FUNG|nr:hypothetical protein INT48_005822 [Thamnidium elegans]
MDSTQASQKNQPDQNEQLVAVQQRILDLEQIVLSQASAQLPPEPESRTPIELMDEGETLSALHSLSIRPSYTWSPSEFLSEVLSLDSPLFPTTMLTDDERRKTIDTYPSIDNLNYQPPDTIPMASRKMNKYQTKQDMSLKRLQYMLSGVFRPLDVLGLEISRDATNDNVQRYLLMLKDCRTLLLNVSAQINDMRNNIAFQAINPSFTSTNSANNHTFTMSTENGLCRRQQQWMGMQHTAETQQTTNHIWTLDASGSTNVDQLERIESSVPSFENFPSSQEHADPNQNGQYNLYGIHKQAERNPFPTANGIGHQTLEVVPSTRNNNHIKPRCWNQQYDSGLRISTSLSEKQLDDRPVHISTPTTTSGTKRRRYVCRQDDETTSKVRILATGPGQLVYRRLYHPVESISSTLPEPALEPNQSMPPEDNPVEVNSSNNDHPMVAQCVMVPNHTVHECDSAANNATIGDCSPVPNSDLANDKQFLEACRLELIRTKYQNSELNDNAQTIFINNPLEDNPTNMSYKPGQLLFLKWCIKKQISQQFFTPTNVINFLSDMRVNRSYAISTLQLFRSAVTHFHHNPRSLQEDENINSFITTLLRKAPPTRLHRSTINLQPTIDYLSALSSSDISLSKLQSKLAFILGITFSPSLRLTTYSSFLGITRLLRLSTMEQRVSLRSIASSLALQSGIPKDDIVTMGNWSSSTIFEQHYRREHLSHFDFTNILITKDDADIEDDIFFDANEE